MLFYYKELGNTVISKYGISYKGSKQKIAEDILNILPPGERLVDIFGGGFAITHCALIKFPDKWKFSILSSGIVAFVMGLFISDDDENTL